MQPKTVLLIYSNSALRIIPEYRFLLTFHARLLTSTRRSMLVSKIVLTAELYQLGGGGFAKAKRSWPTHIWSGVWGVGCRAPILCHSLASFGALGRSRLRGLRHERDQ